jgi:hypothetical protein
MATCRSGASQPQGELTMKNPLESIVGTIVSGLVLTVVLYVLLKNFILAGV